jgi:biotin carboxylase
METILIISSAYKGDELVRAVKNAGCRVILMTEESLRSEPWPRESIDELILVPDLRRYQDIIHTVSWMNRGQRIDYIQPLDEFEVEIAAFLREHLRLPGPRVSPVRHFRDKLIMREITQAAGMDVPPFIGIKNYDDLRAFMAEIPAPWVLKPRSEAGSMGIKKVYDSEQVWRALDELGDRQSFYLLEKFIPGDVYHVDALTVDKAASSPRACWRAKTTSTKR